MRIWAQCLLCSRDRPCSLYMQCYTQGQLRLYFVMSSVLSGLLQLDGPVVVIYQYITQRTLPLPYFCFLGCSLWPETLGSVLLTNCPEPSLNLIARATRNLSGLWQVEGDRWGTWTHRTVVFASLTNPGATLESSHVFMHTFVWQGIKALSWRLLIWLATQGNNRKGGDATRQGGIVERAGFAVSDTLYPPTPFLPANSTWPLSPPQSPTHMENAIQRGALV